jgi:hypothetical protein
MVLRSIFRCTSRPASVVGCSGGGTGSVRVTLLSFLDTGAFSP